MTDSMAQVSGIDRRVPLSLMERLFDTLPDVVFFAKDRRGRYTHANQTLLDRLRLAHRSEVVGRRVDELFTGPLGRIFATQDEQVLRAGLEISGQLELHLYPNRAPGWCLTHKLAWREAEPQGGRRRNAIVGLVGISRDLRSPEATLGAPGGTFARVAAVVERLQRDFGEPLVLTALARDAGVSMAQLERQVMLLYRLTPRQVLARARLDAALRLLPGGGSVAEVAHACGYTDH
ncbi:MAG TPA: AraC family transcriptional regulator, partial [Burkholderiaceae bacterium]|nr:AraC family transcriptional regulator [Burkholderiaceae bacterium]